MASDQAILIFEGQYFHIPSSCRLSQSALPWTFAADLSLRRFEAEPAAWSNLSFPSARHSLKVRLNMTPDRKAELIIKRNDEARRKERLLAYTNFKELIAPLDCKGISYIVSPTELEFDNVRSASNIFDNFEFSDSGHLCSEVSPEKSESWSRLIDFDKYKDDWVFVYWKGESFCISIKFSDLTIVMENLCIDYHWDSYIFNPVSIWLIEFHHDGWVSYQPSRPQK